MAVELAAAEYGAGPPVAILHGLFGSGRNWRSVAQHLAARHRVLIFDVRNHGASPWADEMSYDEMVEDLRASFRARGLDRAALLGHSMGGKVAMLMALLHPDEVDRLVIVDMPRLPIRLTCSPISAPCGRSIFAVSRGAPRLMPLWPGPFPTRPSALFCCRIW